jgi:hypothetical protein
MPILRDKNYQQLNDRIRSFTVGTAKPSSITYSSPRAAAILWQGNSNYYACWDADKRHKQTPVNYHFRSIPVSLQGSKVLPELQRFYGRVPLYKR